MTKPLILFILLIQINILYSKNMIIGCDITSKKEESCKEEDIFSVKEEKNSIFKLENLNIEDKQSSIKLSQNKKSINITEKISSINVTHRKKKFTIIRTRTTKNQSCPPNCIQPINIQNIKTVGTLETLKFIEKLNSNRRMILVDSRAISNYKKQTIPTATNIPNSILKKGSKHIEVILRLLGAKKDEERWIFNHIHTLLIFDNGISDNNASKLILRFIELGYPQDKILYYHGGLNNWKSVGLTTT